MRTYRAVMVGGASAVILTAGWVAAPDPLGDPTVEDTEAAGQPDAPDAPAETSDTGTSGDGETQTVDGPVVSNIRGEYQVRLVIVDGEVVDVEFPIAGTEAAESRRVNEMALPVLEERILEAQSGDVEYVSGASYTSPAMAESAAGAFDEAGL